MVRLEYREESGKCDRRREVGWGDPLGLCKSGLGTGFSSLFAGKP